MEFRIQRAEPELILRGSITRAVALRLFEKRRRSAGLSRNDAAWAVFQASKRAGVK